MREPREGASKLSHQRHPRPPRGRTGRPCGATENQFRASAYAPHPTPLIEPPHDSPPGGPFRPLVGRFETPARLPRGRLQGRISAIWRGNRHRLAAKSTTRPCHREDSALADVLRGICSLTSLDRDRVAHRRSPSRSRTNNIASKTRVTKPNIRYPSAEEQPARQLNALLRTHRPPTRPPWPQRQM